MVKFNDIGGGYSKYVEIDLGTAKMIVMSGHVAMDGEGKNVGEGNMEQQAEFIFSAIKSIVEKAGGSMANIIKLTNYLTDIAQLPEFKTVRDKYVNTAQPPASTTLEVSGFVRKEWLLEVEAMAVISKS